MRRFRHPLIALALLGCLNVTGVAQCISRTLSVSRVQGAVFDQMGRPIPDVDVSLKRESRVVEGVETDGSGRFSIRSSPGAYDLYVNARNFVSGDTRIEVGNDLIGVLRPTKLWVILQVGMLSENCGPFVTTSRRQFENATKHDPRPTDHN